MILREMTLIVIAAIVVISAAIGFASRHYLGNDNPIEEAAEEVIQLETGVKVDLSP